ncbi:hypothetical protein Pth03_40420 [Planotetraspora thailandica]|uniref:Tetratricopeptide repeat protein n=1 Tax=Planotetraspora thailandica TaxID=487172 RepID=A0A8J3XZ06_9ACTN|nr:hypothetical protein [Planotetraspora thailandica]GII55653.1 hypothetical protein Pth03_40420 [Planotetraspora thailandica]
MGNLRFTAEKLPLAEVARLVGWAAAGMSFEDLTEASSRLAASPGEPQAMYDFGYACVERGVPYVAIPALREALRHVPGSMVVVAELVEAFEGEGRHAEAVAVLAERDAALQDWPDRYLLTYNAIMAGDLPVAEANFARLAQPGDPRWRPAWERAGRMLGRAAAAAIATSLDHRDLRGWHFVLTGGILATISPHGFDQGMNGRYAYQQDTPDQCLLGLLRLRRILEATRTRPRSVSVLPDRSSRILGLAAAEILGLPAEPYKPGRTDTVVVAYDLNEAGDEILTGLRDRAPGEVLFEHATCWTDPPQVTADVSVLLRQAGGPSWGGVLRAGPDGSAERTPPDERPADELAAEIVRAEPESGLDSDADGTPADTDEVLSAFVVGVADRWLAGPRDGVRSSGPVPSSRFR